MNQRPKHPPTHPPTHTHTHLCHDHTHTHTHAPPQEHADGQTARAPRSAARASRRWRLEHRVASYPSGRWGPGGTESFAFGSHSRERGPPPCRDVYTATNAWQPTRVRMARGDRTQDPMTTPSVPMTAGGAWLIHAGGRRTWAVQMATGKGTRHEVLSGTPGGGSSIAGQGGRSHPWGLTAPPVVRNGGAQHFHTHNCEAQHNNSGPV